MTRKRKISPDLYQELRNNFEGVLSQLKKDAQTLSDEATKEITRCNQEIKTLGYAVVNLELEHEIGQVDDEAYNSAFAKSDIEQTKSSLSNIMLGDSSKPEQKTNIATVTSVESKEKETLADEANKAPEEPLEAENIEETKESPDETPIEAPELPEPPVVVYVKEVGKAGI